MPEDQVTLPPPPTEYFGKESGEKLPPPPNEYFKKKVPLTQLNGSSADLPSPQEPLTKPLSAPTNPVEEEIIPLGLNTGSSEGLGEKILEGTAFEGNTKGAVDIETDMFGIPLYRNPQTKGTPIGNFSGGVVQNVSNEARLKLKAEQNPIFSAIDRGILTGEVADIINSGATPTKEDLARIAELKRQTNNLSQSDAYRNFSQAETISDQFSAFASNPLSVVSELVLESFSAQMRHGITRMGAGAVTGAVAGSAIPGLGTATGIGYGILSGMGVTSLNLEYSGKIIEALQEAGIDVTDAKSLEEGFANEELMAKARDHAWKKAVPVAVFDMFSGGVAGKVLSAPAKTVLKKVAAYGAETAIQSGLGMAGEAAGQIVAGEDISLTAIAAEGIGEIGGGAPEIVVGTIMNKKVAGEPTIKETISLVANLPKEGKQQVADEMIDVSVGTGQITNEQATEIKAEVAEVIRVDEKIPVEITPAQRSEIIPLIQQKETLETQKQTLETEKLKLDPNFHPLQDEKIAEAEKAIEASDTEIKKIIAEPEKEVGMMVGDVKRIVEPIKPISEMNSEEMGEFATETRRALKKQDKEFENKTEKEKEDGGYYDAIDEVEDLRDTSERINFIENAENINDLADSVKSTLSNMKGEIPNEYQLAILNAAKNKAIELGIDTKGLIKNITSKIANQFKDIDDAELMVRSALDKLILVEQTPKNVEEVTGSNVEGGKKEVDVKEQQESSIVFDTETKAPKEYSPEIITESPNRLVEPTTIETPKTEVEMEKVDVVDPPITGITHAQTNEAAKSLGLPEYEKNPETFEQWDAEAQKRIEAGEMQEVVGKLNEGKQPSAVEQRMMAKYAGDLLAKIEKNPTDELINQYGEFKKLSDEVGGREVAKSLVARQNQVPVMENVADMYLAKKEAIGVDVLTDVQKSEIKRQHEDYRVASERADEKIKELQEQNTKLKADLELSKTKKGGTRERKTHEQHVEYRKKVVEDISKKLRDIRQSQQAVIVPYARELISISPDVAKLVADYVAEGVTKLEDIVIGIHGALKEHIPDIKEKDVHDIIAGEYTKPKATKTELQKQVQDLKFEAKLINQLEKLQKGERSKTEKGKVAHNQKVKALKDQIADFKKKQAEFEGAVTESAKGLTEGLPEEKALQSVKKQNENATKKINEKIAKGEFAPAKKISFLDDPQLKQKYPKLWNETMDAIIKKQDAQNEFDIALKRDEMARRGDVKKVADFAGSLIATSKAIASGIDDSAIFIQNIVALIAHPKSALRVEGSIKDPRSLKLTGALPEHLRDFFSEKRFNRQLAALHNSPAWDLIQKSGLDITEPKSLRSSQHEEIFDKNLLNKTFKIRGKQYNISKYTTKPFERLFTSMGNNTRANAFIRMSEKLYEKGVTWENNPKQFTDLAKILNNETGRGKLPEPLEQASGLLTAVLWSPRLIQSSINLLGLSDAGGLLVGKKGYYDSLTPRMQVYAAASMGKYISVGLAVMGAFALQGWEPDLDPISVTFGTMEKNGKRVSIFGRFTGYVKLVAQSVTGKRSIDGLEQEIPIEKRAMLPLHFLRGKTTPFVGAAISARLEKDFLNKPTTLQEQALTTVTPLSIRGVANAIKNEGMLSLLTTGIPSMTGINISYEEDFNRVMPKSIKHNDADVELSDEQQKKFQDYYEVNEQDYLNALVNSDEYKKADDETKLKYQSMVSNAAKTEAEAIIKKEYQQDFKKKSNEQKQEEKKESEELKALKRKIGIKSAQPQSSDDGEEVPQEANEVPIE